MTDDGALLVYDFTGRGPNQIPRKFFRELNALLESCPNGLRRIQKSVVIGREAAIEVLSCLVRDHGGNCKIFRVLER